MKRGSATEVAIGSAFVRAGQKALRKVGPASTTVRLRIHPAAHAFVAGVPGLIGATFIGVAALEPVPDDGGRSLGSCYWPSPLCWSASAWQAGSSSALTA